MSIEDEIKASKDYLLTFVREDIKIPILTIDNVARVEAMIQVDSRYSNNRDEYNGETSSNFFHKLKEILKDKEELKDNENTLETCIYQIVRTIDKENSTHLNSNIRAEDAKGDNIKKTGRYLIADKILQFNKKRFLEHLTNPDKALKEDGLFRIIEISGGRKNTSFASKFCHYACFNLFDDKNKDNYSIYDAVIRMALPIYIKWHKVTVENINYKNEYRKIRNALCRIDYKLYQTIVDTVLKASESDISRNGFDHLLWYYFKGKNEQEIEEIYNSIDTMNNSK
ncbi:MAG: hypothetical protein IJZ59_00590 [Alphaproteobacteria bacterium]|nr:hypothetical protein [Alphaproteobacteria bacterium]